MSATETTPDNTIDKWARERAEKSAARLAFLAGLVGEAKRLLPAWTVIAKLNEHGGPILLATRPGTPVVTFEATIPDYNDKGRVHVHLDIPSALHPHTPRNGTRPSGTFSRERGSAGLVSTIKKLVAAADAYIRESEESKARTDDHAASVRANAKRIATVLGVKIPDDEHRNGDARITRYVDGGAIDVKVYSDSATIEVRSLPIDLAEKVLKLIRDNTTNKGE